jgi:hypothetical protein
MGYWRRFLLVLAILAGVWGTSTYMMDKNHWYDAKVSVPAVLTQAYNYDDECGYKNRSSCTAWMGRFRLEDGRYMNLQIDGFFYANFVRLGERDYASAISVSPRQLGVAKPEWYNFFATLQVISFGLFGSIFIVFGLAGWAQKEGW